MTQIGIILWGEVLLKSKGNKIKIFIFSGDSLNEEIIFPNNDKNVYEKLFFKPGVEAIK